ncbi:MAG: carboxypeptidase-like regulatory domain-containing protein, partial [Acidobacteriota bacterium]
MSRPKRLDTLLVGCFSKDSRYAVVMVAVLLLCAPAGQAQTTFATVTGAITDETGGVVPGVSVTALHVATNTTTQAVSNDEGVYTLAQLKEGEYVLRASLVGFREFVMPEIILGARDYRRVDIRLQIGGLTTIMEVQGGATLIETETARIADAKTAETLKRLPLNTRSIYAPLALSPNVLQSASSSTLRFAGSTHNQANWVIDGITMSDGVSNTQIGTLADYIEWVQEVKIDMANNTADVGPIGQVTIISKSGTNDFHGSVFDYY